MSKVTQHLFITLFLKRKPKDKHNFLQTQDNYVILYNRNISFLLFYSHTTVMAPILFIFVWRLKTFLGKTVTISQTCGTWSHSQLPIMYSLEHYLSPSQILDHGLIDQSQ